MLRQRRPTCCDLHHLSALAPLCRAGALPLGLLLVPHLRLIHRLCSSGEQNRAHTSTGGGHHVGRVRDRALHRQSSARRVRVLVCNHVLCSAMVAACRTAQAYCAGVVHGN